MDVLGVTRKVRGDEMPRFRQRRRGGFRGRFSRRRLSGRRRFGGSSFRRRGRAGRARRVKIGFRM